jgi:hypothetical protein
MAPSVRSSTFIGDIGRLGGFSPRSSRWVSFHARVDMGDLPILGDKMAEVMKVNLTEHLRKVAMEVVNRAQSKLYPGHGFDTGQMSRTLTAKWVDGLMDAVAYDLESDDAFYWVFVEFGHMTRAGNWWPGYHFLTESIMEMEADIRDAVRMAWNQTVVDLAGMQHVPLAGHPLGLF